MGQNKKAQATHNFFFLERFYWKGSYSWARPGQANSMNFIQIVLVVAEAQALVPFPVAFPRT